MSSRIYNTEDKLYWVQHGLLLEYEFVEYCQQNNILNIRINPAKLTNKYAPDLLVPGGGVADLKTQHTPFFMATEKAGINDPSYAVTFNRKDYERYVKNYADIFIFFWVNWQTHHRVFGQTMRRVRPVTGVWYANLAEVVEEIEGRGAYEHFYKRRVDDKRGNAKSSFVFDVRRFHRLFEHIEDTEYRFRPVEFNL